MLANPPPSPKRNRGPPPSPMKRNLVVRRFRNPHYKHTTGPDGIGSPRQYEGLCCDLVGRPVYDKSKYALHHTHILSAKQKEKPAFGLLGRIENLREGHVARRCSVYGLDLWMWTEAQGVAYATAMADVLGVPYPEAYYAMVVLRAKSTADVERLRVGKPFFEKTWRVVSVVPPSP